MEKEDNVARTQQACSLNLRNATQKQAAALKVDFDISFLPGKIWQIERFPLMDRKQHTMK